MRKSTLPRLLGSLALAGLLYGSVLAAPDTTAPVRTRAERDALTPAQVLQRFKDGNERFVNGTMTNRDLLAEQRGTAAGQYPSAVVLSCMDSRAPAEFVFDKGIGEIFNARIAGNVLNPDLTGSLEYACAAAGAKMVLVLGHTECGAVKGAIDHVELGSLTGLLERIHPALEAAGAVAGGDTSANPALVRAVTDNNVELTVAKIRRVSPLLREMEQEGKIVIVGGIYDVSTGRVRFLEVPPASH